MSDKPETVSAPVVLSPVADPPEDTLKAIGCTALGILALIYSGWTLFMLTWGFAWSHGSHERSGIILHLGLGWAYLIGSMLCFRMPMRGRHLLACCLLLNVGIGAQLGAALMSVWVALLFLGITILWVRLIVLRFRAEGSASGAMNDEKRSRS